jgi:hypothetical protein
MRKLSVLRVFTKKIAQIAAMKAMTEAARLSQAIRRAAAGACSRRATPSSNAWRTAAAFHEAASSSVNAGRLTIVSIRFLMAS